MIKKLIGTLLLSRDVSHVSHWKTDIYAHHIALNEFYDEILDKTDELVENYQGRHGILGDIPIMTNDRASGNIVRLLELYLKQIEDMRYKAVDKEDAALQSIMDEIVRIFLRTLYKLRQLK